MNTLKCHRSLMINYKFNNITILLYNKTVKFY